MNQIIALWTHPRSISTAFERVMMERRDFTVLHEPFSYLYYVQKEVATIAQQYVDPNHPTDYADIRSHIIDSAVDQPVFFKDMCSHCFEELRPDNRFLRRLTNTFLIRDPAKAIASYYAMNSEVTVEEIGIKQLCGIYEQIRSLGDFPIVIDADDLENDPEGIINAYCKTLGIRFISEALTWESENKEEWEIWKDWHKDAAQSTGICKNVENFAITIDNSDHLRSFYDDQMPYYQTLYTNRIKPQQPK